MIAKTCPHRTHGNGLIESSICGTAHIGIARVSRDAIEWSCILGHTWTEPNLSVAEAQRRSEPQP